MTEPISGTTALFAVTAAGGVTVLGLATGLDPALMLAGACGGWWAQSYQPPTTACSRLNRVLISSVVAAWSSPPVVQWWGAHGIIPKGEALLAWEVLCALGVGLLAVDVLGKGVIRLVAARLKGRDK